MILALIGLVTVWLQTRQEFAAKSKTGSDDRSAIWNAMNRLDVKYQERCDSLDVQLDRVERDEFYWKGYRDAQKEALTGKEK